MGGAEGKSWDCKLASAGSVRGVDFDAALHALPAFRDLETVPTVWHVHCMMQMQSSEKHGEYHQAFLIAQNVQTTDAIARCLQVRVVSVAQCRLKKFLHRLYR